MSSPVICFGQQPCGFFPRRFLYAKFVTARKLQAEIGGEIVFFCHDSDHDPRETQTTLRHRKTDAPLTFNFTFANKTQRKFSPLYAKKIPADWRDATARLRGTDHARPRCAALSGTVGARATCGIYEWRPNPCREFEEGSDACAQARRRHGLPPLGQSPEH